MKSLGLKTRDTLVPDLFCIEVIKLKKDGKDAYLSQIVLILDKEEKQVLFLPTDIFEDTALDTIKRTLRHLPHLFGDVGSLVHIFDGDSGEIIQTIDLNKTFSSEAELDNDEVTLQQFKMVLH